jgi:hypothetical protein
MTPQTLAHAQRTRRYFEDEIVKARGARDWHRVRSLDQRLGEVNDAIRKHYQEEAAAADAAKLATDDRLF